jgi:hypothetical protein
VTNIRTEKIKSTNFIQQLCVLPQFSEYQPLKPANDRKPRSLCPAAFAEKAMARKIGPQPAKNDVLHA